MRPVTSIRVPAAYEGSAARMNAIAEFRLGWGRCGRVVSMLDIQYRPGVAIVFQQHDDGTIVEFVYPLEQLTGRIEVRRD
jgi:hypothetical protein